MSSDNEGYVKQSVMPWTLQRDNTTHVQNSDVAKHVKSDTTTQDWIAEECAVALVYNGISHVVMMASPVDLEVFAIGFSFTEGVIDQLDDIYDIKVISRADGIEIALTISNRSFMQLKQRHRHLNGRSGCGICGKQSLEELRLSKNTLVRGDFNLSHTAIDTAIKSFEMYQPIQTLTGAVHGAAWCDVNGHIVSVFEDVGRHNALDKLIGKLLKSEVLHKPGFLMISSRASYEIVQKAACADIAIVVAVSAPTSLAISVAEKTGVELVGFSRAGRHVVYTKQGRVNE